MNQNPLAGVVNPSVGSGASKMMGGEQEYVPAYVDVERFINCLSSPTPLSLLVGMDVS